MRNFAGGVPWPLGEVTLVHETAEKLDSAARDPVDAETRPSYGRSPGLPAAAETNLLPRNGPPEPVVDFFSGLPQSRHFARFVVGAEAAELLGASRARADASISGGRSTRR
jgi:hypothetical protein